MSSFARFPALGWAPGLNALRARTSSKLSATNQHAQCTGGFGGGQAGLWYRVMRGCTVLWGRWTKSFLQGLKPIGCSNAMSELKLRPPFRRDWN